MKQVIDADKLCQACSTMLSTDLKMEFNGCEKVDAKNDFETFSTSFAAVRVACMDIFSRQ